MIDPEHLEVNPIITSAWELADIAFTAIEDKFRPDGSEPKGYHNIEHTKEDVVSGVIELADLAIAEGKITVRDKALLIIAAAYHDITQNLGPGLNEKSSADAAIAAMTNHPDFNNDEDKAKVKDMIMATRVQFDDEGMMTQKVPRGNLLAAFIADADLSSLGRSTDIYWRRATGLFEELHGKNGTKTEQIAFMKRQVQLLSRHEFYTEEARGLYTNQAENLAFTQEVLAYLEAEV